MARKTSKMPALTPAEKRLRNTHCKLRDALERLVKGLPTHPDLQKRSYRLTVATLAREARVGRNAIYANHRSIIDELRRASDRKVVPEKLACRGLRSGTPASLDLATIISIVGHEERLTWQRCW